MALVKFPFTADDRRIFKTGDCRFSRDEIHSTVDDIPEENKCLYILIR
jgi:hypothetical protein